MLFKRVSRTCLKFTDTPCMSRLGLFTGFKSFIEREGKSVMHQGSEGRLEVKTESLAQLYLHTTEKNIVSRFFWSVSHV